MIGRETAEGLRPKPENDRSEKSEWIRQKYVDKAFMAPSDRATMEAALLEAAKAGDLVKCVTYVTSSAALNATPNGVGTETPLIAAVEGAIGARDRRWSGHAGHDRDAGLMDLPDHVQLPFSILPGPVVNRLRFKRWTIALVSESRQVISLT